MEKSLKLSARIIQRTIQIYWLGKWRSVRYYSGKSIPSKKITEEAIFTFKLNSGYSRLSPDQQPTITLNWIEEA